MLLEKRAATLVLVGDGPLRSDLEKLTGDLGISDCVMFAGYQSDPWPLYATADLFVLSSDSEGFGNVLVEALAMGLPVVSTDCGATREILAEGAFGCLVSPPTARALSDAMNAELDRKADGEILKSRAAEFAPGVAIARYLRVMLGNSN